MDRWNDGRLTGAARVGARLITAATAALLCSCGGADGTQVTVPRASEQAQREADALQRAHAINVDAMGKIKAERAAAAKATALAPTGN